MLLALTPVQEYGYKGEFWVFDPGESVDTQVGFIPETSHENNHENCTLKKKSRNKKNSRDSGSSSKDRGNIHGSW